MTYAFTFDASACSGCKACQIACKDKNNLPAGVLWRRVYEVSGGSWQRMGEAWISDVFAYNLSVACNHCVHPKCAGVCPTDAYIQREDGIVYIDESKCIGCGYCSWACPYAAPRYNPELGHMTKCNFCYDQIDSGLPPACVAACPIRVLDYATIDDGTQPTQIGPFFMVNPLPILESHRLLWKTTATAHPFPLPQQSRTEPHLAIKPHAGMLNSLQKTVSNREEIWPGKMKSELPLVTFTLLGQIAAGIAVFSFFSGPLPMPPVITIGCLILLAGLASLLHLGHPINAWRAIVHLKKSWLSREILMFGLFGLSWFVSLAMPGMGKLPLALSGIGLVYSMGQVYRLRSIPAWDSYKTPLAFALSAILLGSLGLGLLSFFIRPFWGRFPHFGVGVTAGLVVAFVLALEDHGYSYVHQMVRRFRLVLIAAGLLGALILPILPDPVERLIIVPLFVIVLLEEGLGRWLFYEHSRHRAL